MKNRTITGLGILAVLILVLFARGITTFVFDVFILAVAAVGIYEMTNILSRMKNYNNKYLAFLYVVCAYSLLLVNLVKNNSWYIVVLLQLVLIIVFMFVQILQINIMRKSTINEIKTRNLSVSPFTFSIYKTVHTTFAYLYPSMLLLFFVAINNLHMFDFLLHLDSANLMLVSNFALILTFIIPMATDTFAYIFGSIIKGKKLCPKISPKKTISGAVFGFIFGTVAAFLLFVIFNAFDKYNVLFELLNFKFWQFIIIGAVCSVAGQAGDIFESLIKRKAQIKDSGTIFPGHGGVLDRVDSLMFVAPIVFVAFLILI